MPILERDEDTGDWDEGDRTKLAALLFFPSLLLEITHVENVFAPPAEL